METDMTPLSVPRSRSGALSWVAPSDIAEWARRAKMLEKAKAGDEDALADARDSLGLRTWIHRGKVLIEDGILRGAKP